MASEITSANVANAIVKLVAADAMPALVGNLVLGNIVNRSYESALANAGDVVNVPIPPVMVANNLAEAGSVQNQNPSPGNAQIVLQTHAEATFVIPDVTKALAVPDLLRLYMEPAIIAVAERIETDLCLTYPLLTAITPVGSVTALTEAIVDNAESALFTAKVPASDPRYLILCATQYSQLRQLPRATEYQITGSSPLALQAIQNGNVLKFKDFMVFRSQYIQKVSTSNFNLALTKNCLGLVIRRLPRALPGTGVVQEYAEMGNFGMRVTMSYQPNTLSQQFTIDCLYGTGVLRNNHGLQVVGN